MRVEDIEVISIFGAGTMGSGIARVAAQQGYKVFLTDAGEGFLNTGIDRLRKSLQRSVERGTVSKADAERAVSLIIGTLDLEEAVENADFVIEAIPEKAELKKELFRRLDELCGGEVILATNTSTISITELASAVKRPERFIGMHFFNPAQVLRLVEIIKGLLTSDDTTEVTRELALRLGKDPIIVEDSPGFATSRLGLALFIEASRMLEEGVTSAGDIDKGMKLGYGHPMGPFELCDLVGLDARLNNINAIYESTRDPLWKPPKLLKQLVNAGYLGTKPGSRGGYYKYFGLEK